MRKYHFPFIDLDKEEAWINRCVRQGWRLKDVNIFIYEFIPQKTSDRLKENEILPDEGAFLVRCDVRKFDTETDFENYRTMFLDAGWKHVSGYREDTVQYFERVSPCASEGLFSDSASKTGRYLRLAKYWLRMLIPQLLVFFSTLPLMRDSIRNLFRLHELFYSPGLWELTGLIFWAAFLRKVLTVLLSSGLFVLPYLLLNIAFAITEAACAARSYQLYCKKSRRKI